MLTYDISAKYNIPHQYSDPEIEEQSKLGIMNEGVIGYYGKYRNGWSRQEIKAQQSHPTVSQPRRYALRLPDDDGLP